MDRFAFRIFIALLLIFIAAFPVESNAQSANKNKTIRLGILLDVEKEENMGFVRQLETELSNLLQPRYTVSMEPDQILQCNWSTECIEKNYQRLVADPRIDIIVGIGPLNSAILTRRPVYPKPFIAVGVIDPEMQNIPVTPDNRSGVANLTFITFPQSLDADMESFFSLYPFKKIALIEDRRLLELFPIHNPLTAILAKRGIEVLPIGVDSVDVDVDKLAENVDAVIIGSLYRFEKSERAALIEKINRQRLPTFAIMGEGDLKLGALATTRPATDSPRLIRRVALNIERILNGEDPATLPIRLERQQNLYVNMTTARRIGFSPSWDILLEAELIDAGSSAGITIGLTDTITQALAANRTLAAQRKAYQSKEKDVGLARTQLFPQVGLSAGARVVDENQAIQGTAERTVSGAATLDQVLFSESLLASLAVRRHEMMASEYSLDQTELDTVLSSGVAYFDILRAITNRRIRRDYMELVKENLHIAQKRLAVGYAGAADVYRWESELASAKNSLIEAHTTLLATKQRLNQILFRPIDEEFSVADVHLSEHLFSQYPEADFRKYVDNPASMKLATDFLVAETTESLPEIKEIDEAILANERILTSYGRKRFLPDVVASARTDQVFSRDGAGSEIDLPDENSWQVGVNASWPLFPGGEISVRTRQLRIDISRLQTQRADLIHGLELTLRNNVLDLVTKTFNIELSRRAAEAGAKSLDLVQDSYEKGLVAIVQLLDAQNVALTSKLAAANAVYEYFISYLNLERSMGRFVMLTTKQQQVDFFNRFEQYLKEHRKK